MLQGLLQSLAVAVTNISKKDDYISSLFFIYSYLLIYRCRLVRNHTALSTSLVAPPL